MSIVLSFHNEPHRLIDMNNTIITIFGATGFIGSELVRVLAAQGFILRLPCKHPKKADMLKFNGDVGQIVPITCDYTTKGIDSVIAGSHAVINCTGILAEKGHKSFMGTHCYLPEDIAKSCVKNGVEQFIHISALGVGTSHSHYAKSKLAGEQVIRKNFDKVTIIRPSVVFGAQDNFFNMFAKMGNMLPFLPLIGGGKTLFQPVYVGDVANAISNSIKNGSLGTYELGGPDVISFKDILNKLKSYTGQNFSLLPVPFFIAKIQAVMMSVLPNAPITSDQIRSLKTDSIVDKHAMTLSDLNVKPTSMDQVLPSYLERFKK